MITKILQDYQPDHLTDTEDMYRLKKYIYSNLTEQEKRILVLYADLQSMRQVAQRINVSTQTISNYIRKIKEKIKNDIHTPTIHSHHSDTNH